MSRPGRNLQSETTDRSRSSERLSSRKAAVPRQEKKPPTITPKKSPPTVVFYLGSCPRCTHMCSCLTKKGIPHQYIDIDKLSDKGKSAMWEAIRKNPQYDGSSAQVPFLTSKGRAWFKMGWEGFPTFDETANQVFEALSPEEKNAANKAVEQAGNEKQE